MRPNLESKGRWLRGALALAGLAAVVWTWGMSGYLTVLMLGGSLFVGFEAVRGWCAMRACGLKTRF